jgi:hypothetical protein
MKKTANTAEKVFNKQLREFFDGIKTTLKTVRDDEGIVEADFIYGEKHYKAVRDMYSDITGERIGSALLELKNDVWVKVPIRPIGKGGRYPEYSLGKQSTRMEAHRVIAITLMDNESRAKLLGGKDYVVNHMIIRKAEVDYSDTLKKRERYIDKALTRLTKIAHTEVNKQLQTFVWVKNDDTAQEDFEHTMKIAYKTPHIPVNIELQLPKIDVRCYEIVTRSENNLHGRFIHLHKEFCDHKISAKDIPLFKELLKRHTTHLIYIYENMGREALEKLLMR